MAARGQVLLAVGQTAPTLVPWGQRRLGNVAFSGGAYLTHRIPFAASALVTATIVEDPLDPGPKVTDYCSLAPTYQHRHDMFARF
jgi:hypothetical protein